MKSAAASNILPRKPLGPKSAMRRGNFFRPAEKSSRSTICTSAKIAAFCGVGNPAGFRHTLESCGFELVGFRDFPDHHRYSREDIESLSAWANELGAEAIVCTHKDLVKIGLENLGGRPLWALRVGIEFLAGGPAFEERLMMILKKIQ